MVAQEVALMDKPEEFILSYDRNQTMVKISLIMSGEDKGISDADISIVILCATENTTAPKIQKTSIMEKSKGNCKLCCGEAYPCTEYSGSGTETVRPSALTKTQTPDNCKLSYLNAGGLKVPL